MFLKQSTAAVINFGPAVDKTDGVTLKTGLVTALDHASTGIFLSKNGGTLTIRHATVTATTYDAHGFYKVTLDTTDTATLGHLMVAYSDATTCLPIWRTFQVITANIYDSIIGGTDLLDVSMTQILGTAVSTPATAGILDANVKNINNVAAATPGAAGGVFIAGTNAATSITTALTANVTGNVTGNLSGSVGSVTGAVGSVTGAVGSVTGSVGSVTGAVGSVTGLTAATVHADLDDIQARLPAALTGAGNLKADALAWNGLTTVALPATPTNITAGVITTVTNLTNAPTAGDLTTAMKASVKTQALDVLATDTYAEPGQGAPAATTTLAAKINYLYKFLRNKVTQTSTTLSVYDDAGTTVDHKATVADDATTYSRSEIGTGP